MKVIDQFLSRIVPVTLFHYTTTDGLIGILENKVIWCSSAFHMNDVQEFRYALGLITARLKLRLDKADETTAPAYKAALNDLTSDNLGVQAFVASFSEDGDLLSQWLAYAATPATGYSIGFSPHHFEEAEKVGFRLVQCVYDEAEQIRLADAVIDVICEPSGDDEGGPDRVRNAFLAATAIKHPGFEKEGEWRLVKIFVLSLGETQGASFRQGRNGLVPYFKAPLSLTAGQFVPPVINIGPKTDMDAAVAAMRVMLDARGLLPLLLRKPVTLNTSRTPYRP